MNVYNKYLITKERGVIYNKSKNEIKEIFLLFQMF